MTRRSWRHWLTTTNHKDVGVLYIVTSLVFAVVGGLLALLIRVQLAVPESDLVPPGLFNQAVTMHGAIMVLFFISPFSFGFANYVVPLQIGARDLAFPRINALSYWLYLAGGLVAGSGFLLGGAADVGWTFYSPLTSIQFSPNMGVDLAGIGLLLLAVSVTISTINFLVTILRHRAPGLSLYSMPMFTWSVLFTLVIMLFAFPALAAALLMLVGDRHYGTHFFSPDAGGPLLWTHLFWFFGHPEVYIVLLPGVGAVLDALPVFARHTLYGKKAVLWALAVATLLSFAVWVHHMFTTGADAHLKKLMSITTESISVPFGVIFLCMIATLWGGRIRFPTPMLFSIGFLVLFLLGGLTGVFLSSVALDQDLRGTYFVVSHFHYTLVGGAVVGMIAGLYYWYPLITGRLYDERLGRLHFWLSLIGFNLIFLPLFSIGEMPRRIYTYRASEGWASMNFVATLGAFVFALGQVVMFYNLLRSLRRGRPAGTNPWEAPTPEWSSLNERVQEKPFGAPGQGPPVKASNPDGTSPPSAVPSGYVREVP